MREAVDIAFFVGAGIVFIGFNTSQSANSEDAMIYLSTRYTGKGRKAYEETEIDTVQQGINFGWFMVFCGLMWAFISYLIYYLFN